MECETESFDHFRPIFVVFGQLRIFLSVGGGEIAKVSIPSSEFCSMEFKA